MLFRGLIVTGLVGCMLAAGRCPADEPSSTTASTWQAYFRRLANEYRLVVGEEAQELKLLTTPVLKWTQPVRGGQDGAVYLWLSGRRPAVVGTFFIWPNGDTNFGISHELHALTSEKLDGNWRN